MVEWKSYTFQENLYLCEQQIQVFSLLLQTTHLLIGFNSRGKIFKGGELETTVRVISFQKNYKITL